MIKAFLCLFLVCSSSFVGCFYSHKLYKRKEILLMFSRELCESIQRIRYERKTLADVFSYKFSGFAFSSDKSFSEQWCDMLKNYEKFLKNDDLNLLVDCGEKLGKSDIYGEEDNINLSLNLIKSKIKESENEIEKKSKLYRTLGLCSGIAVSILLF